MSKIAQETGSEWYFKWAGVLGVVGKNLTYYIGIIQT